MPSLADRVRKLIRPATHVIVKKPRGKQTLSAVATKFGGSPYAEKGDAWPRCGGCGKGLTFGFQVNLADCPHDKKRKELFAFYYCQPCHPWDGLPDGLEDAWVLRRYPAPDDAKAVELKDASPKSVRIRECAVKLALVSSLPDWEGLDDAAPAISKLSAGADPDEPWEPYRKASDSLVGEQEGYRTQIGGYPHWVQGEATPTCRKCRKPMRLLAQIDSELDAGIMWGDSGCVYLFECEKQPRHVDMQLQCF